MYLVKPNGNYNILITDIGVTVSFPNSILVEKSKFDNSNDAKKLIQAGFILVEEANEKTTLGQSEVPAKTENAIFVAREEETKINNDVFVRQPEEDEIVVETSEVEEITVEETVNTITEEVKVETVEKSTETSATTEEVTKEVTPKSNNKRVKK